MNASTFLTGSSRTIQMNDITINYLLQTIRILHVGNYTDEDLEMVYRFTIKVDNDLMFYYLSSKTILSYDSDLELFVEVVNTLINIYEESEEYEKCVELKIKRDKAIKILNN